jgi:aspartate/methionine/tyrosine aminotransferase
MVAELRRQRTPVVDGLDTIPGIRCLEPQGAFYAFPNVRELGLSSDELADRLLQEAGVATLAGTAFGSAGEGYLRLSYANSIPNLQEALHRLAAAARQYRA